MKQFHHILIVGIDQSALDQAAWTQIEGLAERVTRVASMAEATPHATTVDCLLLGFGIEVKSALLETLPSLTYISVLSTAYDAVEVDAAKTRGIVTANIPGYSTESVAEFTIAALLEQIRDLRSARNRVAAGDYTAVGLRASELKGKVFGIIGLGAIGGRVAELAQGFGADVRYWSRTMKPSAEQRGIHASELNTLLSQSDFLSLNVARTPETHHLLNAERLALLKPGAIIVSTVSLSAVDQDALRKRLHEGNVTFITMFTREVPREQFEALAKSDHFVLYPLITASTNEARQRRQQIFLENLTSFLEGKPTHTV